MEQLTSDGGRKWVLRLLYAPDDTSEQYPAVLGITKLAKMLFVMAERLTRKKPTPGEEVIGFRFEPDNYGPMDPRIYRIMDELQQEGLITDHRDGRTGAKLFKLTPKGVEAAKAPWSSLNKQEQTVIQGIKSRFNPFPLSKVLTYVYSRYPTFTTKSLIRDQISSSGM